MSINQLITPLEKIQQILAVGSKFNELQKTTSLTEVTNLTNVEPLVVVSSDCLKLDYLPDIMQTLVNLFASYYLQAINLLAVINDVKIAKTLDRLNPDREFNLFSLSLQDYKEVYQITEEAYKWELPTPKSVLSLEALPIRNPSSITGSISGKENKDLNEFLLEPSNLAVGKLINVSFKGPANEKGEATNVTLPISIRLAVTNLPNQSMLHLLTLNEESTKFDDRFNKYKLGMLNWKEMWLCVDLIESHKKALMNDKQGVYSEIVRRVNNSKKYGLTSMNPSLVSASSIFVISDDVAKLIENKLSGKLDNARVRQIVFENTYAMIIAVINQQFDRITFYSRGIHMSTEVSIRDIKKANSNKGPDIYDMLKAFNLGNAPSF